MNTDSPYFDRIRIRPKSETARKPLPGQCEHPGCTSTGGFRAPKGRGQEGKFWNFCLEHVQGYNKTYNYFDGLPDEAVGAYQRDATTGHRPTWAMGVNPWAKKNGRREGPPPHDNVGFFDDGAAFHNARRPPVQEKRKLKLLERKALDALDLPETAEPAEIKARYKTLVKRLHPDANGGDRSSEEQLRSIIQAYNTLRSAGLC